VGQATAIDVEGFKNLQDGFRRNAPRMGPADDIEVFLTGLESIQDSVEQQRVIVEFSLEESKITAV
jgi:hypothetical protein